MKLWQLKFCVRIWWPCCTTAVPDFGHISRFQVGLQGFSHHPDSVYVSSNQPLSKVSFFTNSLARLAITKRLSSLSKPSRLFGHHYPLVRGSVRRRLQCARIRRVHCARRDYLASVDLTAPPPLVSRKPMVLMILLSGFCHQTASNILSLCVRFL